ncbi:hypothetical protein SAMN06265222_101828 [Neorhodopirellula lusitana]|uniref:Uncharacterized protein n=1 Tax=Neorhodopirellula lusitana TaxID=445327 RepID=A0ABY1PT39_9BACT|nr:hypothetical protein [Neorhodopirellula lusitana]SMP42728.1 hypothetical protein SAMN06265222_101828 [Neorhodopirellula lusitana]
MSQRIYEADALHRRGQALEDEFFYQVDAKLRAGLRAQMKREEAREKLRLSTGIEDIELLDHLFDAGVTPSSIAALALVPVVFVAWADGSVTTAERQVIFSSALHRGMKGQPEAFNLLMGWLEKRPGKVIWDLWKEYSDVVHSSLTPKLAETLQREILRSATVVAEASGGRFGRDSISVAEQAVLDQITDAMLLDDSRTL